jgi:hypothetical protein
MVERLKGTLKNELDALKSGSPMDGGTPKSTPRKRKGKGADAHGEAEASPTKKGRKKKGAAAPAEEESGHGDEV